MPSESAQSETEPGDKRSSIKSLIAGHRRTLARVAVSSFVGGACEALFLVVVTRAALAVADEDTKFGVFAGREVSVGQVALLALGLLAVRMVMAIASARDASRLTTRFVSESRQDLANAFLSASWPMQQGEGGGRLQELLTTFAQQGSVLMSGLALMISAGFSLLALLAMAVIVDPVGALIVISGVAVLGTALRPIRAAVRRRSHASAVQSIELATNLNEISQIGLEVNVFNVQDAARLHTRDLIRQVERTERRLLFAKSVVSPVYSSLAYVALVGALALASGADATNLTSLGAVMLVMLRSLTYGQAIQSSYATVTSAVPYMTILRGELEKYRAARQRDEGGSLSTVGRLDLEDVSYSYTPGALVLRGISLSIPSREVIGIVGPSGGGKSTLVQLLLGLREPVAGAVLSDGRPIGQFAKSEWARKVTFVPQAHRLIDGTIAENIRFMRSGVDDEDVERAARLAHIHDEIAAMPDGYGQLISHGRALSGGQQQRLCIARALVEQPDVLILDEPTSALDVRSEHLIRETMVELKARTTIIIVAHRLSTLDVCDRIIVIQDGELKAFDTPARLAESAGFYREALRLSGLK